MIPQVVFIRSKSFKSETTTIPIKIERNKCPTKRTCPYHFRKSKNNKAWDIIAPVLCLPEKRVFNIATDRWAGVWVVGWLSAMWMGGWVVGSICACAADLHTGLTWSENYSKLNRSNRYKKDVPQNVPAFSTSERHTTTKRGTLSRSYFAFRNGGWEGCVNGWVDSRVGGLLGWCTSKCMDALVFA